MPPIATEGPGGVPVLTADIGTSGPGATFPTAIEEMLRVFAFVPPARKLAADIEYEGCPMKKGQMVLMPLWYALIPDYEIDTTEPLVEHGWQPGLDALPLRWSRQR